MPRDINDLLKAIQELIAEGVSVGAPEPPRDLEDLYPEWKEIYSRGEQIWFMPTDFGGWRASTTGDGRKYFEVTINGARYYLIVGELRSYPAGVFHFYQNAVASYMESQTYKREGPSAAAWSQGSARGENTWYYEPSAPTSGIDLEGRYQQDGNWYDPLGPYSSYHPDAEKNIQERDAILNALAEIAIKQAKEAKQERKKMKKSGSKSVRGTDKGKKVKLPTGTGADTKLSKMVEGKGLPKKTVPGTAGEKVEKGKYNN